MLALVMAGMILLKVGKVQMLVEDSLQASVMAGMLLFKVEDDSYEKEAGWWRWRIWCSCGRRTVARC